METDYLECGCSVSNEMFGDRRFMFVNPCLHHAFQPEIQIKFKELQVALQELYKKEKEAK